MRRLAARVFTRPGSRFRGIPPAAFFATVSILFGTAIALLTPPLRGPDESAHFLRAYGIARGDIVPSVVDQEGRKGVFLTAEVYEGFAYFDALQQMRRGASFSYWDALEEYWNSHEVTARADNFPARVFVRYAGSEGYNPVPYLPHVVAAWAAQLIGLEFLASFYLMRLAGLLAVTAIITYALVIAPRLHWAFLSIAMIPAALYGRAVINPDGSVLAYSIAVTVLWLHASIFPRQNRSLAQAVWLCLCTLSKPPQIVFASLPAATGTWREALRSWRRILAVVTPAVSLSLLWIVLSGGDVAAWRLAELSGTPSEQFSIVWKLGFLSQQPWHFPKALLGTLQQGGELWRQLIGVLGLFDVVLRTWTYPVLTALLLASWVIPIDVPAAVGRRLILVAGLTASAYIFAIFAIFYLVWTPVQTDEIWGVQGRYFIPALPLLAIAAAATANFKISAVAPAAALAGAIISGVACIEAILRVDWNW